ncbi:MAG: hypothetical protein M1831_004961 [Alyxoria varia]|nr:MAG: hypothetical protein M1831_004961 [Alyxoria varia]
MPLIEDSQEHLQHLDQNFTESELQATRDLIADELQELYPNWKNELHPKVPEAYKPKNQSLASASHGHIAKTGKARPEGTGVDLSRYEKVSAPKKGEDGKEPLPKEYLEKLNSAHTSQQYLDGRGANLQLLEQHGKNAWLMHNNQLEDDYKALERDVEATRSAVHRVDGERRAAQEGARGELEGLEEAWRHGLGRAIEAEIAAGEQKDIAIRTKTVGDA